MSSRNYGANEDPAAGRRHGMRVALLLLGAVVLFAAFTLGLQGRLQALFHPSVLVALVVLAPLSAVLGRMAGEQVARQHRAARHRRPPWPFMPTLLVVLPAGVLFGIAGRASSGAFTVPSLPEALLHAAVWVGVAAVLASLKGSLRLWRFGDD